MSIRYFLVLGDSTSCGGHILEGSPSITFHGLPVAFQGAKVSCGKNPGQIYTFLGGIANIIDMGIPRAGTLDSRSSCPCRAFLIPSILNASYYPMEQRVKAVRAPAVEPEQHAQAAKRSLVQEPAPAPVAPALDPEPQREPVEPGFCIVDLPATVKDFGDYLFYNPVEGARELYDSLNGSGYIKPASILLLVDPLKQTPEQVEVLKKAKARIDKALAPLSNDEANFLHRNHAVINSFTSITSGYGGFAAGMAKEYFEEIEVILAKIQNCYVNQYMTRGTLIGTQFFVERKNLFGELDVVLNKFIKQKIGLHDYADIRRALGLSSRSITQKWDKTGVGEIEGYATYIENAAKYVKIMKTVGYIGISLDGVNRLDNIYEACTFGSNCEKVALQEIGSFAGGITAGLVVGKIMTRQMGRSACAAILGLATSETGGWGILACGITVSAIAGYAGGKAGEKSGEQLADSIHKVTE